MASLSYITHLQDIKLWTSHSRLSMLITWAISHSYANLGLTISYLNLPNRHLMVKCRDFNIISQFCLWVHLKLCAHGWRCHEHATKDNYIIKCAEMTLHPVFAYYLHMLWSAEVIIQWLKTLGKAHYSRFKDKAWAKTGKSFLYKWLRM